MSTTNSTVLITVPKYVTIKPIQHCINTIGTTKNALPKIKPAPQIVTPCITNATPELRGKKRRLDHLTWEEKIQRKKLKNRVAAQTSRDRKKARMEEMENEIKDLTEKTMILENKCQSLQLINDSLLEKNQKLDMELEVVRQQLHELQKQQAKMAQCDDSGPNPQGLAVNTGFETKKMSNDRIIVASDSSLPALQDMLLSDIGAEQDASLSDTELYTGKLEELAETLLADITADLETGNRTSDASTTETTSRSERLPRPVVGTASECLESSQHSKKRNNCFGRLSESLQTPQLNTTECTLASIKKDNCNKDNKICITETLLTNDSSDKVYGTYDAKSNSISINVDDVTIPVNEAVEEIYCDGVIGESSVDGLLYTSRSDSSTDAHISLNTSNNISDEEFDKSGCYSMESFLCPKMSTISPLSKSPAHSIRSVISDHGYESIINSPTKLIASPQLDSFLDDINDDFTDWPSSFNELFPTLY